MMESKKSTFNWHFLTQIISVFNSEIAENMKNLKKNKKKKNIRNVGNTTDVPKTCPIIRNSM